MAKFSASEAVEPMEVDFTKYGGPEGTIPEPSGKQVEVYLDRLKDLRKRRGHLLAEGEKLQDEADQEKIDAFLESMDDEQLKKESAQIFVWMQEVTSDFLQADMLENLPPRVWSAFLRWFSGELSPKAKE